MYMSFKCGECGWVIESAQRTAIEIHKLTHVIMNVTKSLSGLGLIPDQKLIDTGSV